ncbi:MAG: histidine triad nucleotide-binding protein [Clostridia bacterium]|nr:histidine triad nucleotide-binding protein [Clostridia bacterium]
MSDCLFCRIAAGSVPSAKVYEDDMVYAFKDIDPQAPLHVLIIPKKHIQSVLQAGGENAPYVAAMMDAARKIAKDAGVDESGFRLVMNTGADGGQTVDHLHAHLLGGRSLGWPPG